MDHKIVIDIDGVKHRLVCTPQDVGCKNCSLESFCNSMELTCSLGICHSLTPDATAYKFIKVDSDKSNVE